MFFLKIIFFSLFFSLFKSHETRSDFFASRSVSFRRDMSVKSRALFAIIPKTMRRRSRDFPTAHSDFVTLLRRQSTGILCRTTPTEYAKIADKIYSETVTNPYVQFWSAGCEKMPVLTLRTCLNARRFYVFFIEKPKKLSTIIWRNVKKNKEEQSRTWLLRQNILKIVLRPKIANAKCSVKIAVHYDYFSLEWKKKKHYRFYHDL